MFCMSERGHGSNVRGITTEAHYDASTQVGHVFYDLSEQAAENLIYSTCISD